MTNILVSTMLDGGNFVPQLIHDLGYKRNSPSDHIESVISKDFYEMSDGDWEGRIKERLDKVDIFILVIEDVDVLDSKVIYYVLQYAFKNLIHIELIFTHYKEYIGPFLPMPSRFKKNTETETTYPAQFNLMILENSSYQDLFERLQPDFYSDTYRFLQRQVTIWEEHDRAISFLLSGQTLLLAEKWLNESSNNPHQPTTRQRELIAQSRRIDRQNINTEITVTPPVGHIAMDNARIIDDIDIFKTDIKEIVQFSAFYPREVQLSSQYAMLVFAHLDSVMDQVQGYASAYSQMMGNRQSYSTSQSVTGIQVDTLITIVPYIKSVTFIPSEQTLSWNPPYKVASFLFGFKGNTESDLSGSIRIYDGPLIIGEIPIKLELTAKMTRETINFDNQVTIDRFDKIFASYSHRDTPVMEYFRRARENIGHKMLVDIYDLRSGEYWSDRLLRMIDESDVFQLFWSNNSAKSEYCRKEWEHAIKYLDKRPRFVQPVWWKTPMVSPPKELVAIHFQKVNLPLPTKLQLATAQVRNLLPKRRS
jgi:hypothetical protein